MARRKNNNFNYIVIIILVIIASFMINYFLWQDNIAYKSILEKKELEIKQLQQEISLLNEKNDILHKESYELKNEKDSILIESEEKIDKTEELEKAEKIEKKYGLVKVRDIDSTIIEDLRYATEDNFVKKQVYPHNSIAILRKDTAIKLKNANEIFQKDGYTIKVLDAYRPLHVQYIFWEYSPNTGFVADPKKGSKHNRGAAVDLTLVDKDGNEIEMGTEFDNFTEKAAYNYPGHTEAALRNMKYLRDVMEQVGFKGISNEWWHFDDVDWKNYEVLDISFNEFE